MTFTIKPVHLAVLAFVLGVAVTAAVALVLAGGSSDEPSAAAANAGATTAPSATSQPTAVPTAAPTAQPTQPPEPEPQPQPAPQPAAPVQQAPQPAAQPPAPTEAAPAAATGPTEEELEYRRRVQSLLAAHITRLLQYYNTPSMGPLADIQELASIVLNYANAIASVQPVPPRYQQARDRVVSTHLAMRDHMLKIEQITNEAQFIAWLRQFTTLSSSAGAALEDFNLIVGTEIPPIQGLRE
jgi:hypothetical protein